jgi:hypothetical protein
LNCSSVSVCSVNLFSFRVWNISISMSQSGKIIWILTGSFLPSAVLRPVPVHWSGLRTR